MARIDWFKKLSILLLSRCMVLWQSPAQKNAKTIFVWKQSKNERARPCLQDFEWLQTVPFKSTTRRAAKRRESNEWNGLGFQYVESRETIYVATNIPRKHVLLSYFRNTCGFPSSGYCRLKRPIFPRTIF